MNVLIISTGTLPVPAYKGGAVEKLIEEYINYNEENYNCDFTIYTIMDNQKNWNELYKYTKFEFIDNTKLSYKFFRGMRYLINNKIPKVYIGNEFIKKIVKKLKRCKKEYDVIIVENNPFAVLELRKIYPNKKIILHLHNDYLNLKTKKCKEILASYDEIIAISQYVKERVETIHKSNKIKVIYNGINTDIFSKKIDNKIINDYKKTYDIQSDDVVLLFVGRLIKEKGIQELILATNELIKQYNNIKLLVIGSKASIESKNDKFINHIIKIANKNNIFFVGHISYEKLPIYHQISDIQIIPSKWGEPLGNVVIEGLASGIKQIVTNDGGIPEIVKNTNTIIIEKNDLKDNLYKEISKLINEKDENYKIKSNNKVFVDRFSNETYSINIIKELKLIK